MSKAMLTKRHMDPITAVGAAIYGAAVEMGDLALFALRSLLCVATCRPRARTVWPCLYRIGVLSVPVVTITGGFIGMVLAVQTYDQFRLMRMESLLGAVVNISLVKELGPVLAATMLAGRVGGAMAAELATMKITEQIDALRSFGADPIRHLVVPRFLGCFLLIPLLTALADGVGILGGWAISTQVLGVDSFHFWHHADGYVTGYDVLSGLFKSVFFGGAIAIIACHRGFACGPGAEGVGRAATEAFVRSFVAIMALDLLLGIVLNLGYRILWPTPMTLV